MSNGEAGQVRKKDPHEITAEDIHTGLNEVRAQVKNILELQVNINEKLVNDPADAPKKQTAATVDPPVNPRHFPGFKDSSRDISMILQEVQRLQNYLYKHL